MRQAAGARLDAVELHVQVPLVAVTDDRQDAAEQFLRRFAIPADVVSAQQLLASPSALIGTVDRIIEDLQARRERYGFSYIVVWDTHLEVFAPVVARLTGR